MRIGGIGGPAIGDSRTADRRAPPRAETESRALIAVAAPLAGNRPLPLTRHPSAPFLAHLIATQMQAPQTRARRRATPEEAIVLYDSIRPVPVTGRMLRRQA
jgi:hypothetical protein